jgi:trimethylamine--corrinoid protein Co-methyltransferase
LLYPESIILDDDIYHRARFALMNMEISPETLALDVIQKVGPRGHFLAQKHTRKHMPSAMKRSLLHQLDSNNDYRDPVLVAQEKVDWILKNHKPEPLEEVKQAELARILSAAGQELGQ